MAQVMKVADYYRCVIIVNGEQLCFIINAQTRQFLDYEIENGSLFNIFTGEDERYTINPLKIDYTYMEALDKEEVEDEAIDALNEGFAVTTF